MIIVQLSDFVGYHYILQDPEAGLTATLQNYIDKYEPKFIYKLLGSVLGATMIEDCQTEGGVPIQPLNLNLFNPININDPNSNFLWQSEGLKNVLLNLIWYEFVCDTQVRQALAGFVNLAVETGNKLTYDNVYRVAEAKWNEALEWIYAIQWYCLWFDPSDYLNTATQYWFQGQEFGAESSDFL